MVLHELVTRGRILFKDAPKRYEVFLLVNGRRSAKDIAHETGRTIHSTLNDLKKMRDMELIILKLDKNGKVKKKDNSFIFEKNPIIRHLSKTYFSDPIKITNQQKKKHSKKHSRKKEIGKIAIPSKEMILDICKKGENQLYEFKRAGTEVKKITKEICAFANTKFGGLILYGIEDKGEITGSDMSKQELDQPLQNSIKNSISPSLVIDIIQKEVIGKIVIIIRIAPWERKNVYHYCNIVHIRIGTNAFPASTEQSKILHQGNYVV